MDTAGVTATAQDLMAPRHLARCPGSEDPILLVVIDTEEEFAWRAPHDRAATSVTAMARIGRAQDVFDQYGIRPCYVVDYPVASNPDGYGPLKEYADSGRCLVGAHLHPWVNPPHEEQVCEKNSFPGNLDGDLEERKLEALGETIAESFGARPTAYKAGRYGIGAKTGATLERLGYEVDLSTAPPFDFRPIGGPDFSGHPNDPFWFGKSRRLLGIPGGGGFTGFLGASARPVYRMASRPFFERLKLPGILSRLHMVDRIQLSPEGFTVAEHKRLTRALLRRGTRVFTYSFHSPSVEPGHTPYVRSERDLALFLDSMRRYFDYFFGELGGRSMTPLEIKQHLTAKETAS